MARIRCTFFFTQTNTTYGWTESFYNMAPDLTSGMLAAQALLPALINPRGQQTRCTKIRVSDETKKRNRVVYLVPFANQVSPYITLGDSDPANTAVNFYLAGSAIGNGRTFMRGLPDAAITLGGQWTPGPLLNTLLAVLGGALTAGSFAIRYINPPPALGGTGPVPFPITAAAYNAAAFAVLFVTTANNLSAGPPFGYVNITGLRGYGAWSGIQKVTAVPSPAGFNISSFTNLPNILPVNAFGQVVQYVLTPITGFEFSTVTHRITGRPSGAPRGRQRVR